MTEEPHGDERSDVESRCSIAWPDCDPVRARCFSVLSLVIGALTGLVVVAFIVLTERLGMRLYPVSGAPWRRLLFPVAGSLGIGYLLYRFFPKRARQRRAAD